MPDSTVVAWTPGDLWSLADRNPSQGGRLGLIEVLCHALLLEEKMPLENPYWNGWTWRDVRATPTMLHQAELAGIIRVGFHSRSQTCYLVNDRGILAAAIEAYSSAPPTAEAPEDDHGGPVLPADAFDVIVGHEMVKQLVRRALSAPRPVHVLLTGPPGTAKTLFLADVAQIPGARYALGSSTTKAGLLDYLLAQPNCRVLVIDELDKANVADLSALLSIMETGLLSRLQHGRAEHERRQVWVIAGANRIDRMPAELLSRFAVRQIPEYTAADFQQVVRKVLVRRESVDPELAGEIASRLAGYTTDVRTAVRAARLCQSDRRDLSDVLELLGIPY
ncbi:MAG TPA: AAA family ATPase [Candidatus Nanopelagicaceae bacterium]|nr:AAA family ATPase [Candidatus Nanopelagicaceae bacterium]